MLTQNLKMHAAALTYLSKNNHDQLETLHPMFRFGILNPEEIDKKSNEEQDEILSRHYRKLLFLTHPDKFIGTKETLQKTTEEVSALLNQYKPRNDTPKGLKWKFIGSGSDATKKIAFMKNYDLGKKARLTLAILLPITLPILFSILAIAAVLYLAYQILIKPFIDLHKKCSFPRDMERYEERLKNKVTLTEEEIILLNLNVKSDEEIELNETQQTKLKENFYNTHYIPGHSIFPRIMTYLIVFVLFIIALPFFIIICLVTKTEAKDKLLEEKWLLPTKSTVDQSKEEVSKLQNEPEFQKFLQNYYPEIQQNDIDGYFNNIKIPNTALDNTQEPSSNLTQNTYHTSL